MRTRLRSGQHSLAVAPPAPRRASRPLPGPIPAHPSGLSCDLRASGATGPAHPRSTARAAAERPPVPGAALGDESALLAPLRKRPKCRDRAGVGMGHLAPKVTCLPGIQTQPGVCVRVCSYTSFSCVPMCVTGTQACGQCRQAPHSTGTK